LIIHRIGKSAALASPHQNSERSLETLNRQVHVALHRQSFQVVTGICFCGCAVAEFVGVVRFRSLARSASSVSRSSCSNLRALVSWLALVVDYLGLSACARADSKQPPLKGSRAASVPENFFVSTVLGASPCSPVSAFREALETPAALVGGIAVESQARLDIVGPWKSSDNPGVGEFT
jgi:hypothetical protein